MVSRLLSLTVGVLAVLSFPDCFAQTQLSSFMELPNFTDFSPSDGKTADQESWRFTTTQPSHELTPPADTRRAEHLKEAEAKLKDEKKKEALAELRKAVSGVSTTRAHWVEAAEVLLRFSRTDLEKARKMELGADAIAFCTDGLNARLIEHRFDYNSLAKLRRIRGLLNLIDGKSERANDDFRLADQLVPRMNFAKTEQGNADLQALADCLVADPFAPDRTATLATEKIDDPKSSIEVRAFARLCRSAARFWQDRLDESLADLEVAVELQPEVGAVEHRNRGRLFWELRKFEKAVAEYDCSLKLEPDAETYLQRACAHGKLGHDDQALADFNRSIDLGPTAKAFLWRGSLHYRQNNLDLALADLSRSIELEPSVDAYEGRADIYCQKKEYAKAIADLTEMLKLDPTAKTYAFRGILHWGIGNIDAASDDFTAAIAKDPNFGDAFLGRAKIRAEKGDADGAVADYEKVIQIDPNIATAHIGLGITQMMKDDSDAAIKSLTKGIELDPTVVEAFLWRAHAYLAELDFKSAKADYVKAAELDPRAKGMVDQCEHADRSLNDDEYSPEKAIEFITEQITNNPKQAGLFYCRAKRYRQAKEWKKAWDDVNETVRLEPDDSIWKKYRLNCGITCFNNDPAPAFRRELIETLITDATAMLDVVGDPEWDKPTAWYIRSVFYWYDEEYAKALDDFDAMVKELGDKAPMTRLRRAFTQLRLAAKETNDANRTERLEKALEDAETVIRLDDKRGEAFFCRSKVHEAMDETEKAQEDRRQAELLGFRGDENALFVFEQ